MVQLTDAQWREINELIKEIYVADHDSLLKFVSEKLMDIIPSRNSMYHLYRYSDNTILPYDYKSSNIDPTLLESYKSFEYLDYVGWYSDVSEHRVYRDTDLISEELRLNTEFMKNWLLPNNMFYSLGSTIAYNDYAYAAISLFRPEEDGDFSDIDMKILEVINEHLSIKFYLDKCSEDTQSLDLASLSYGNKYKLTDKECEIISLVKSGYLRDFLPDKLCVSENTLKKHLYNIYRKLNINKFEELMQIIREDPEFSVRQ